MMASLLKWIVPWEFSWVFLLSFIACCVLYARGSGRLKVSFGRRLSFWTGMAIIYVSLHTYLDYFFEHEFFMHRIQQILLHHLAPLLIIASYPGTVLHKGVPFAWRLRVLRPVRRSLPWRVASAVWCNPAVATVLFVAFILIWLIPSMQTLAMLDWRKVSDRFNLAMHISYPNISDSVRSRRAIRAALSDMIRTSRR